MVAAMSATSRKSMWCLIGVSGLIGMALVTRQLVHWDVPALPLRVVMLVFILLCPVLLGMAIGVWGGDRGGIWGARGVSAAYLGVVVAAWAQDGAFPVGFRLPGLPVPLFVTLTNLAIFLMTIYFMRALGGSGGRLGSRVIGAIASTAITVSARPDEGESA
jgi:hypothetical protein